MMVSLATLGGLQTPTGRVAGIARISPRLASTRARVRVYAEPGDPGIATTTLPGADPFANVVLYLEDSDPLRSAVSQPRSIPLMRQHDEHFTPHVLPIMVGTSVTFPNDDPIYHNVFSLSRARTFDLGRYPKGTAKSLRFGSAGVVQVFCHIHADMSAYILVLPNRYFVTPDSSGRFAIESVPPGEYRLVAWHERIRPIVTAVRIDSGRTTDLELNIPIPDARP